MAASDAVTAELALAAEPEAVAHARKLVRETFQGTPLEDVVDDAELVVTELVTNAVLHGAPPVVVRLSTRDGTMRIAVTDANPNSPVPPRRDTSAMTGRGLALISALTDTWGVEAGDEGKTVWAELSRTRQVGELIDIDIDAVLAGWTEPDVPNVGRHLIRLGDVPTDLLLEAKTHVDNLVREFALAAGGAASGATAEVPPHLADLIETVTLGFAQARQAIKRQALAAAAAGQPRTHLELSLPVSAAEAGEAYLKALDEADDYARAARLLTLETPPQHRAFRRWYVTSLVEQLRAVARGETPPPTPSFERHLLDTVGRLTATQRASERAARLQTVTAALAHATTAEEVALVVVSEGLTALGASGGSLFVPLDEEHLAVPGSVGYPQELIAQLRAERRDAKLPAAEAMRTGRAVWLESRQERDERYPELRGMEPYTVSMCALPLFSGTEVIGALRFSFDRPRLFDEDERRFAEALAAQTAAALDRSRLFAVERQARARTTFLAEATEMLTATLDATRILHDLTALLVPSFADWVVVFLVDDHGAGRPVAFAHRDPEITRRVVPRLSTEGFDQQAPGGIAEVLRTGRTLRYARVPEHLKERTARNLRDVPQQSLLPESGVCVPLLSRGAVIGAIGLARMAEVPYTEDEVDVIEDVAARASVAVVNAQQYERERTTALTLQRNLLPQRVPAVPGLEFAWRYLPAGAGSLIGGDWYDVLPLDNGHVALVIGDVMGRGLQAAAMMGQLRATARAYAGGHRPPQVVLQQLDAAVNRLEQGQITTAAFAVLDPAARTVTVASAGHLPPLVVPKHHDPYFVPLEPGPPLGADGEGFTATVERLEPGSMLLLYTDGLVEDRTRAVDAGMDLLRRAARGADSAEELCQRSLVALDRTDGHDDDTALLAVALTD